MHEPTSRTEDTSLRQPNSRRWTADEIALLRRVAWTMTAAQIGLLIGRTALAVRTKAAHERVRLKVPTAIDESAATRP